MGRRFESYPLRQLWELRPMTAPTSERPRPTCELLKGSNNSANLFEQLGVHWGSFWNESSPDQSGFCFHMWASHAHTGGMHHVVVRRTSKTLRLAVWEMYAWRTRTLYDSYEPQPYLPPPATMSRWIQSLPWNDQSSAITDWPEQWAFIHARWVGRGIVRSAVEHCHGRLSSVWQHRRKLNRARPHCVKVSKILHPHRSLWMRCRNNRYWTTGFPIEVDLYNRR